jgi:hypothetical protein
MTCKGIGNEKRKEMREIKMVRIKKRRHELPTGKMKMNIR